MERAVFGYIAMRADFHRSVIVEFITPQGGNHLSRLKVRNIYDVVEHGGHVSVCCRETELPYFVRGLVNRCRTGLSNVILTEFGRCLCSPVFKRKLVFRAFSNDAEVVPQVFV